MIDAEIVERMERGVPALSADEASTREVYRRLIGRIRDLELVEPPPGSEERMMARWRSETTDERA